MLNWFLKKWCMLFILQLKFFFIFLFKNLISSHFFFQICVSRSKKKTKLILIIYQWNKFECFFCKRKIFFSRVKKHLNFSKSILKFHCISNSKIISLFYNVLNKDFYFITHKANSQNIIWQQIHFSFHKFCSVFFFKTALIYLNMLNIRIYVKFFFAFLLFCLF